MKSYLLYVKSCLVLFCLSVFTTSTAQTIHTEYAARINQVFAGIDKNRVPHHLLIDYAMEFAELAAYDGTITSDNIVHRGTYTAIYNTLLMARVQTNVPDLVHPTTFKTNWDHLRKRDTIALSGLYYTYSKLKADAYPNSLTVSNGRYYDKFFKGTWRNPYEEKQVFAMAAPILKYKKLTLTATLPASLWYTNQASTVQNIAVDFGDGNGYQNMTFGQYKTISYAQAGLYEWNYKLTLTNNQVLYAHSKIHIEVAGRTSTPNLAERTIDEPCAINALGIDEVEFVGTQTYLGQRNTATLEIDYANDDCTIRRPLIVAEGFDSGLLGTENGLGDNEYEGFIRDALFFTGNLADELQDYDIIYVNWGNGKDHLQRNALLLEDIIAWVNSEKVGNTPNVVLGQSMGGVIARYALTDMEERNLVHDTSLYISHDAPHQGANIPLGVLYFARHLVDQFVSTPLGDININPDDTSPTSIEDIQALIDAPGTQQLLINTVASNFSVTNTLHTNFFTELRGLNSNDGYPQLTRNIAISNGSHCANPQPFSPTDALFSIDGDGNTSILTDFLSELLSPLGDIGFIGSAILLDEPGLLLGILPGNSSFNLDFGVNALPDVGQTAQIYKGKIVFTKKLLWVLDINTTITDRSYNNPTGVLPFDYYPGGQYLLDLIDTQNSSVSAWFGSYGINIAIVDGFDFIPTPTSLDVGSGTTILNNADYFEVYTAANPPTGTKAIPFDNFITAFENGSINEQHISFNARNGNWLATELNADPNDQDVFDCSFICDPDAISGPSLLCASANFSVGNATTTTTWTLNPANAGTIVINNNTDVTVNITPGFNGSVVITAAVASERCGNAILTKDVHFGRPTGFASVTGDTDINPSPTDSATFSVDTSNLTAFTTIDWVVFSNDFPNANQYFTFLNAANGATTSIVAASNTPEGYYTIQARVANTCGFFPANKTFYVNEALPDQFFPRMFTVYPNPTNGIVHIELIAMENNKSIRNEAINGQLYDIYGGLKRTVKITNNAATFDTRGLATGVYILKVDCKNFIEHHQIIVK
ncbi:T9SS type A sorting domain-containing protein [Kordia jejudonensis]|uniref:T9SS type A sorting domain-containing protein n=1 Tax=Kordia jejudonensis TaxID=1348245 RepID=UPI0006295E8B|nr:T9SS type A sorting domain-containing protein [Kordia jejudonensis]